MDNTITGNSSSFQCGPGFHSVFVTLMYGQL